MDTMTKAAADVLAERKRQIEAEGWSLKYDDEHTDGGMATAAACYALASSALAEGAPLPWRARFSNAAKDLWPWDEDFWRPSDPRRMLVKAAALLLAEIERLDRMEADIAENADYLAG